MSAESPRHARSCGPLTVPSQPPSDRSIIDAVSGFINDVTLSSSSNVDPKDVIQWARFETADINEPTPEGDSDNDINPLLLILGYGSGVQVWLIPPAGEAQEVLSWRQGTVRVLRILPTPQHGDCFASKRPLIALCDSASPGPSFCSLSFISIRCGEQVKNIKFKNPILDVLANKRSVVVSFSERFAVFDAATLEDRMAITTCYPCPCPLGGSMPINPLALGDRWLAYADKKLNQSKRSSGGCEGEGVTSYTATVLHAAKSLSKGLRGLGESVAHSLAGGRSTSQSPSPPNADMQQPGVVTVVDIEGNDEADGQDSEDPCDPIVAHFIAHSEAIIALKFDASGMLLVTADRRGHDFHVFRINPHPCGPSLASVHHLYILHRGDTTAKVQDIAISGDSRWTAISTLRGTTHVFAMSPYGGPCGVRTHTQPRVVNRLSRFHRSAGLPIHAAAHSKRASGSPVGDGLSAGSWFPNPRLPPYPLPTTSGPLAQLRPTANLPTHTITRTSSGRQRLSSLSEDSNSAPLLARARFGLACGSAVVPRGTPAPVTALYLMTANGTLLHLVLHPRPLSGVPKEKICDESPIELQVEGVAQWALQRPAAAADLLAPLPPANPLLRPHPAKKCADICMSEEERWLSQVEIVTHAGPHRRLWMGPQFVFKTYNSTGSSSSLSEAETVEVDTSAARGVARSNPVNMPGVRPIVPVLIDSGSASSLEHSPSDSFRRKSLLSESGRAASLCDVQLKEDLAEAMKEDHGWREQRREGNRADVVTRAVDPLGCVVQARAAPPPPPLDADAYTRDNADEATFRPVVRAPASLPPAALLLRPLPRTTTIPVQPLPRDAPAAPQRPPRALDTHIVIPAALGDAGPSLDDALTDQHPTLPENRPPDIQAAPLDECPTRASVGLLPADASCKVSECVRECEAPPADGVATIACSDSEVPAEAFVSNKKDGANCSVSFLAVGSDEKSSQSTQERSPRRRSSPRRPVISEKCSDNVVSMDDMSHPLPKKLYSRSTEKSPSSQKRNNKKESKSLTSSQSSGVGSEIPSNFLDCAPQVTDTSAEEVPNKESSEVNEIFTIKFTSSSIDKDAKSILELSNEKSSEDSASSTVELKTSTETFTEVSSSCQPEDVAETSKRKRTSCVETTGKKESRLALGRRVKIPSVKSSKDSVPATEEVKTATETLTEASSSCQPEMVAETSQRKSTSLAKSTDKKVPRLVLARMRPWKQASSFVDEQKQPSAFSGEESCTEMKAKQDATVEKNESSLSKLALPMRPEEPLTCLSGCESRTEIPAEDVSYTSLAKELREASQDKTTSIVKVGQIEAKSFINPISSISKRSIKPAILLENEIKSEDQAWDMLLNEPEKPSSPTPFSNNEDKSEDSKPKSKRNRKVKKTLEETQSRSDENSFVEIHAIEEKQQPPCDDLVSISSPFEDVDTCSYVAKTKKPRSCKSLTPDKTFEMDKKVWDFNVKDDSNASCIVERKMTDIDGTKANIKPGDELKAMEPDRERSDLFSDLLKPRKSKSLSPYMDNRKSVDSIIESDLKDVYVIDSTTEEFPEIQITRGNKSRKKSPLSTDSKAIENHNLEKPAKSWSSIAASKTIKKVDELEYKGDVKKIEVESKNVENFDTICDYNEAACGSDVNSESSKRISLHEKLFELCKRRDILVAECDVPSELNFVEEHHSVPHDLPPLEPLNFGLDDFKLEVMRDSLLEVNESKMTSPICKINIDDILSSLKDTTTKAIESSCFNLIDLQKVPTKKEKGFSVIESQKITSHEIKIDDDRENEIMEKSSDEDNTSPVTSTDSDKDDRKSETVKLALPFAKQQAKAKKSRRKKK